MPAPFARLWRLSLILVTAGLAACRDDPITAPSDPTGDTGPSLAAATGPLPFVQVTQGITHSCGVTADDRAYCWGDNVFGELGDGTTTRRLVPRAVAGGLRFRLVSAGNHFTCGLTTEDRAYCWGDNLYYTLGDGTIEPNRPAPVAVAGTRRYRQLRAGTQHVCAVTLADVTFCWGSNGSGQLGAVTLGFLQSNVPLNVETGGLVFRRVVPGGSFTCELTADGVAYCWGRNTEGQLGDGTFGPRKGRVVPTKVLGGHSFSAIGGMASTGHTCAVTPDHRAYCWGDNSRGQLGIGTLIRSARPAPVN